MVEQVLLAACGRPTQEQMDILKGTAGCGEPTLEQRKGVRRKEQQRGTVMY